MRRRLASQGKLLYYLVKLLEMLRVSVLLSGRYRKDERRRSEVRKFQSAKIVYHL